MATFFHLLRQHQAFQRPMLILIVGSLYCYGGKMSIFSKENYKLTVNTLAYAAPPAMADGFSFPAG